MKIDLNNIPQNAGVYIMKNSKDKIIYIGKAKNIQKRVSSYFSGANNKKTMELVKNIHHIDYFICNTEIEAFILENNLIKKHKPKYNILLKDQKTYPYIKITKEEIPRISIARKVDEKAYYFGPFPNISIKNAINTLIRVFKIRDCKINVYKENKRACLKYYMKLCNAPCVYKNKEVMEEYSNNVKEILNFLENKNKNIVKDIEKKMYYYSLNEEYEKAIIERDKLKNFNKLLEYQLTEDTRKNDEDIFTFDVLENNIFLCVLSIRDGKVILKDTKIIENSIEDDVLDRLIVLYYENNLIPNKIILDYNYKNKKELLKKWFKEEKKKEVNIVFPKTKGRAYKLLELSNINLVNEKEQFYSKKENVYKGLIKLKESLKLKKLPKRIECFDISNIQGTNPTAAMTVAIDGVVTPKEYRHFKIRCKNTPDDFAMMREALTRRYSKLEIDKLPDLILIDGGKGQISVAVEVLSNLKKDKYLDIISIAKKEELIFKDVEKKEYVFDRNDEALRILQRLRDEAHRFCITHHRKLRSKRVNASILDEIEGIGEKRKKKLLEKFKTVDKIFSANIKEIAEIVPLKVAESIKNKKNNKNFLEN